MKTRVVRLSLLIVTAACAVIVLWAFLSGRRHPVALIRVLDAAGKPVAGAIIKPDGLRTKPGPYSSGHYGWRTEPGWPPNDPASTDGDGFARVQYPKFVFERIESGQISFSVNHPEFVPDRPFRTVTTTPPAGAPWRNWAEYVWNRIQNKALIARTDAVVLQRGAILKLSVRPEPAARNNGPLFAQASGAWIQETNFWVRPEPGAIITRQLATGPQEVRAIQFDASGSAWFSDVISLTATAEQTNDVVVELKRGITLQGQLDATVPRPVTNGRVVAHVWPQGLKPQDSPPQWHAWTSVRDDGTFEISSLPAGELEIVALCNGFVSTNGPGQSPSMHYPQKHLLGTNDVVIRIGLERTACLEIEVQDDHGNPLKAAKVSAWPNVRYGEWSAIILTGDLYNSADLLRDGLKSRAWWQPVPDFQGISDSAGLAVIHNLPSEANVFNVEHPDFVMPAIVTTSGDRSRSTSVKLIAGQTNRVVVRLEPRGQSPIAHY